MKYRVFCATIIIAIVTVLAISFVNATGIQGENKILTIKQTDEVRMETTNEKNLEGTIKRISTDSRIKDIIYKETKVENDIYRDNETKDEYIFRDEKMVGFLKKASVTQKVKSSNNEINKEEARNIVEEFAYNNITQFEKYELVYSNYTESYGEYCFIFMNKINNLNTGDIVKININGNGEIMSYSAFHQGEFEKYQNTYIDVNAIKENIQNTLENKYGDKLEDFEITNQFLRILDGKLTMQNDIVITLSNTTSGIEEICDTIIYEVE